jgi:hypothetical protein
MVDGVPRSWRHFSYGVAHLDRARARDSLRAAAAAGVPTMKKDDAQDWFTRQRAAASWGR